MVVATNVAEETLAKLREMLEAGDTLYDAAHRLAGALAEHQALWNEKGGDMLYAWAVKALNEQRRRVSGLPLGYRADRDGYVQDRRDEIMSQWVGSLEGEIPRLVQVGAVDKFGCPNVAANYERLERADGREKFRWIALGEALEDDQAVRDMTPDLFMQIWWAP